MRHTMALRYGIAASHVGRQRSGAQLLAYALLVTLVCLLSFVAPAFTATAMAVPGWSFGVEQLAKLTAASGDAGDTFGCSVAADGNTAVIGSYYDDGGVSRSGSAYVYTRSGDTWTQQAKLTASDGATEDRFGCSVAIDGDTIVIGASSDGDMGANAGSAYVFTRSGTTWTQQDKLTASDGAVMDFFGSSVAVSGDTAVVGAWWDDDKGASSGSAYVFSRSGTDWTQQDKLTASDGAGEDWFGYSVAVFGDTALATAPRHNGKATNSGAAYVFTRSGTDWTQQTELNAEDGAASDFLGYSVGLSYDTAVIGAHFDDDKGAYSGSAYVFTRSGTDWTQQAKLTAADGAAEDNFGTAVSVDGETAVVGACNSDSMGAESGSAYLFTRSGAAWTQKGKLMASDAAADDSFGRSVAVSGDAVFVGAPFKNATTGAAYIYGPATPPPAGYVKLGTVRFARNSSKLTPATRRALRRFAQAIAEGDGAMVEVKGFTSNNPDGGSTWRSRRRLSLARARAVRSYLASQLKRYGSSAVSSVSAGGSAHPVASNKTKSGRAKNRRAEVWVK